MKTSLRVKLNSYIQARGQVSYQEIKQLCESGYFGRIYRISNAERRLRKSESPDIEAIEEGGAIKNYRHLKPIQYQTYRVINPMTSEVERIIQLPK